MARFRATVSTNNVYMSSRSAIASACASSLRGKLGLKSTLRAPAKSGVTFRPICVLLPLQSWWKRTTPTDPTPPVRLIQISSHAEARAKPAEYAWSSTSA
ncbi:hypothetical protein WR25_23656 [Diploscapter pachys]|uniref:Uncharacterized protein n=1 Tax=Diploscapter pachys TaxID=2018661 RepID=A0A2A2M6Y6_9BILA|nr:hypothetical protein WR25_23656 [Diploscapter pachys]